MTKFVDDHINGFQFIAFKAEEIKEAYEEVCDEDWTELDKKERITDLQQEKGMLQALFEKLQQNEIPAFEYEFYPMNRYYLFGCQQHGHAEYT